MHDCQPGDGIMDLAVMDVLDEKIIENVFIGYAPDPDEKEVIDELFPSYLCLPSPLGPL